MRFLFGKYSECENHAREMGWDRKDVRVVVDDRTFKGRRLDPERDELWYCSTWYQLDDVKRTAIYYALQPCVMGGVEIPTFRFNC